VSSEAASQTPSGGSRLASKSEAKASTSEANKALRINAKMTSLSEANMHGEARLASPKAKRIAFKKAKALQPKRVTLPSLRVSVLDRLGPVNIDLRDYLSNKRKFHFGELVHVSLSHCGQVVCQLVIVHSVNCCLELIRTTSLQNQLLVSDRLSA